MASLTASTSGFTASRALRARCVRARPARAARACAMVVEDKATLAFVRGVEESVIPDVKLTRSRDGGQGTANFTFQDPSIFQASSELGDITGLYMNDEEGEISTVDVVAKFVNGKPSAIEAKYIMRSSFEWDRFMRFMERYAEEQELGFQKS